MSKVISDPLFKAISRPKSWLGAEYNHLIVSVITTMILFINIGNPMVLLVIVPMHIIGVILFQFDPYFYNILRTLGPTKIKPKATSKHWGGTISFSPAPTRWRKR